VGVQSAVPRESPWRKGLDQLKKEAFTDKFVKNLSEEPPSQSIALDYVFGYRSFDCRNNLRFDKKDQIVYHQAALGVVLAPTKKGDC
jgi:hypothetical protein